VASSSSFCNLPTLAERSETNQSSRSTKITEMNLFRALSDFKGLLRRSTRKIPLNQIQFLVLLWDPESGKGKYIFSRFPSELLWG